jgi:hypothetical protein
VTDQRGAHAPRCAVDCVAFRHWPEDYEPALTQA